MIITKQDILNSKVLGSAEKQYLLDIHFPCACVAKPTPKVTEVVFEGKSSQFAPIDVVYKNGRRYDKVIRVEETIKQVTEVFYNKKANEYLYTQDGMYVNDSFWY